ncbi:MAG: T9SS type A sorting domain-containing protein [Candidatus Zixiibacteriota bacterium]|nr:MAG: T9SS type A sorting domain-containing protein [candidate division Zixibacteria bacterium]
MSVLCSRLAAMADSIRTFPGSSIRLMVPAGISNEPSTENIAYKEGDTEPLPTEFALSQNYPNPFNPITQIEYALPEAADVKLRIFNLLGQEVATLIDRRLDPGYHTASWDASDFASGIYLYKLQAGDFVETKKMILLK